MVTSESTGLMTDKPVERKKGFDAEAFYTALAQVVEARRVSWRRVARESGVSSSTLTHMAQGRGPDAASLAVLSAWAGLNPADFVETSMERVEKRALRRGAEPLAAISSLLRADPDLSPDEAEALEQIIRIAYSRFKERRP
jgi:transcriptional regulator with XRE-family HTH domain